MRQLATVTMFGVLLGWSPVVAGQGAGAQARLAAAPGGGIAADVLAGAQAGPPGGCVCTTATGSSLGTGVVWQGTERLALGDIASLVAPVLWFSADEPLLDERYPPIPAVIPCDKTAGPGPAVYYQVTRIAYRGNEPVSRGEEDTPAFFDKVDSLVLRFFFYYPEDSGVAGHPHDIEGIEQEIFLEREGGCLRVRVARVEGLAHGSRWYSNILEIQPDTKFPITVFIEEGKHASAPDRNADGSYMRGYDITARLNDAWGVRDSLGQGVLLASGYTAEMTKPRTDPFRVLPPDEPRLCVPPRRSSIGSRASMGRYVLRPASKIAACSAPVAGDTLTKKMEEARFGEPYKPAQFPAGSLKGELSRIGSPDQLLSVSLRRAGGLWGAGIVLRGLDLREGWIVPRFTVDEISASGELMYTRSASRWFDLYWTAGVRRQFSTASESREVETENVRQTVTIVTPPNWKGLIELGFKFRANLPKKARPFVLGYHFGGVRVGLRGLGIPNIERWQFVAEIGAGAW